MREAEIPREKETEEDRQFPWKRGKKRKNEIPPLSSSFLFAGFINPETIQGNKKEVMVDIAKTLGSLSIDMVEVENQKAQDAGLPLFPRGQTLNNWTSIELPVVFKFQNE